MTVGRTPSPVAGTPVEPPVARPSGARRVTGQIRGLIRAIGEGDDAMVEAAVLDLAGRRRIFAPLGMVVGAFAMLFEGLKLLFSNWRLTLVQLLPAMWIWAAMLDLKVHVFHGRSFHTLRGVTLVLAVMGVMAVTAASFFLNAVFAFAIVRPGRPQIKPAFGQARSHAPVVLASGAVVGLMLGVSTLYVSRFGDWWFAFALSIVIGVMMLAYVSLPSRLIGMKSAYSTTDKVKATAVGGAIGGLVCAPPYALGRLGVLMLGSHLLFIPGIFVLTLGVTLQAGATSAVKAVKMSAKLVAGRRPAS